MASKMAHFFNFLNIIVLIQNISCDSDNEYDEYDLDRRIHANPDMDCYSSQLKIGKSTLASTDSYRDTEMSQLIFPQAMLEYTPHFHQDQCARESKLYLPWTCFKLHHPQTWQFNDGYLKIKTLEQEYTKKFYAVIHGYSQYQFDAFFDNNMAFWVSDLDTYLEQINDYHHILTSYVGLKWFHKDINKTFYSLIIQSPESQRVWELISFTQPDLSLYPNLRPDFEWKETSLIRASFKQYPEGEYPWTGYIGSRKEFGHKVYPNIIPIKISYACANLDEQLAFYTQVMEAKLLYMEQDKLDILDNMLVSYAFVQILETYIEIGFVQRAVNYTYGTFTTQLYQQLIVETHRDRISGIFCGIDRWFDNHYGYDVTTLFESKDYALSDYFYVDRVWANALAHNVSLRMYWTAYSDDVFGLKYKIILFDANGQGIQMIGYMLQTKFDQIPPNYHKQWCVAPCPNNQQMGKFDLEKIYDADDDDDDVVFQIIYGNYSGFGFDDYMVTNTKIMDNQQLLLETFDYSMLLIIISGGIAFCASILYCFYSYYRNKNRNINSTSYESNNHTETTPLLVINK